MSSVSTSGSGAPKSSFSFGRIWDQYGMLVVFADAIHGVKSAVEWFQRNELSAFLVIAGKIKEWRDAQTFDYHKMHF